MSRNSYIFSACLSILHYHFLFFARRKLFTLQMFAYHCESSHSVWYFGKLTNSGTRHKSPSRSLIAHATGSVCLKIFFNFSLVLVEIFGSRQRLVALFSCRFWFPFVSKSFFPDFRRVFRGATWSQCVYLAKLLCVLIINQQTTSGNNQQSTIGHRNCNTQHWSISPVFHFQFSIFRVWEVRVGYLPWALREERHKIRIRVKIKKPAHHLAD